LQNFGIRHSTADYDDLTQEVHFEVALHAQKEPSSILLVPELGQTLTALAEARNVSVETLVNVWLTDGLLKEYLKLVKLPTLPPNKSSDANIVGTELCYTCCIDVKRYE